MSTSGTDSGTPPRPSAARVTASRGLPDQQAAAASCVMPRRLCALDPRCAGGVRRRARACRWRAHLRSASDPPPRFWLRSCSGCGRRGCAPRRRLRPLARARAGDGARGPERWHGGDEGLGGRRVEGQAEEAPPALPRAQGGSSPPAGRRPVGSGGSRRPWRSRAAPDARTTGFGPGDAMGFGEPGTPCGERPEHGRARISIGRESVLWALALAPKLMSGVASCAARWTRDLRSRLKRQSQNQKALAESARFRADLRTTLAPDLWASSVRMHAVWSRPPGGNQHLGRDVVGGSLGLAELGVRANLHRGGPRGSE